MATRYCPLQLFANPASKAGQVGLRWQVPSPPAPGITYTLVVRSGTKIINGVEGLTGDTYTDARLYNQPRINYTLTTNLTDSLPITSGFVSNRVLINLRPVVAIPSAFSPNGDRINDSLLVFVTNLDKVNIKVYNRWGEVVYASQIAGMGWDGKHRSVDPIPDVYIVSVTGQDESGRAYQHTGRVMLIR